MFLFKEDSRVKSPDNHESFLLSEWPVKTANTTRNDFIYQCGSCMPGTREGATTRSNLALEYVLDTESTKNKLV